LPDYEMMIVARGTAKEDGAKQPEMRE